MIKMKKMNWIIQRNIILIKFNNYPKLEPKVSKCIKTIKGIWWNSKLQNISQSKAKFQITQTINILLIMPRL